MSIYQFGQYFKQFYQIKYIIPTTEVKQHLAYNES